MRVLKILAVTTAAIIGVLIVAGVLLVYLIDPNDYKGYVTELVEERTGRSFVIEDDLEWSVFPWFAIQTGGLTIGNHADFGEDPFATVESLSARVRVWPLLRRQIEIGTIVVDGVVLNLGVDADGNGNWSDLVQPDSNAVASAAPAGVGGGIETLEIEGIEVRNGRVLWRENRDDIRYIVSDLELTTGTIGAEEPVPLEARFRLLDVSSQLAVTLDLDAVGALGPGPLGLRDITADVALEDTRQSERASGRVELGSVTLGDDGRIESGAASITARLTRPPIGPEATDVGVTWDSVHFDPAAGAADVAGLITVVDGIEARWQIRAADLAGEPSIAGNVVVDRVAAERLMAFGEIELPDDVAAGDLGELSASADFTAAIATGAFTVGNLRLRLLGFQLGGTATGDANGSIHADFEIPAFEPNESLRSLLAERLPEGIDIAAVRTLGLRGAIDRTQEGALRLSNAEARVGPATITGMVSIPSSGGTRYEGSLSTSRIGGDFLAALGGELLAEGLGPQEIGTLNLRTDFAYDGAADRVELTAVELGVFGLDATGELTVEALSTAPAATGRAELAAFAPRAFLGRFDQPAPATSDAEAFREARITGRFSIDAARGEFRELIVVLDDSRITGRFAVENFEDPTYQFDLEANRLDVDRYLPPPAEEAAEGERSAGDIELRSEPLEQLRLSGRARVGDLKLANLRFQQVDTELRIGDGVAELESARANLYGGTFSGRFEVDTRAELPTMALQGQATDLALAPLIVALEGQSVIKGTGSFDIDLTGQGQTVTDNLNRAAGRVSFSLRDGAIDGFNLERSLCSAFNAARSQPRPARAPETTAYTLIRATAAVTDGIASSRDLFAQTSSIEITGNGRFMLSEARLDYDMRAKLVRPIDIDNCQTMDRDIDGSFPFTIEGPIAEPTILPDFGGYIRQRARDAVEDELRDRLQERLRN